jgi:hypothetical protein
MLLQGSFNSGSSINRSVSMHSSFEHVDEGEISGFSRDVDKISALLRYYAASSGDP